MTKLFRFRAADFSDGRNTTPAVVAALAELSPSDGAKLAFEQGIYHFDTDGARERFCAVSNNNCGVKQIVFLLERMRNLTVDGGGSVFVFHGKAFPFAAVACKGLTLENIVFDRALPPVAELRFRDLTDDGFFMEIDRAKTPYRVENGDIVFPREGWELRSDERMMPLHRIEPFGVQYLFTAHCRDQRKNLPAPICDVSAEEADGGIRFRYLSGTPSGLRMREGEHGLTIVEGGRDLDVIWLCDSEDTTVRNITVRRGCGMGVIAQTCENIEIDRFRTDSAYHGAAFSLTADALHFVNCNGLIEIHDCLIENTMDDAVNVHGIYTELESAEKGALRVRLKHHEQKGVNVYRAGDRLHLIDPASMEIVSEFRVSETAFDGDGLTAIRIAGEFLFGEAAARAGCFVENPGRMPDVHVWKNRFFHFPNLRISGGGKLLIEDNGMECGCSALTVTDLAQYWFESGRVRDLVFRRNRMKDCNALGGSAFIRVSVSGFRDAETPKIHGRVEISDNTFHGVTNAAIRMAGVRNPILRGNRADAEKLLIDGTESVFGDGLQ